MLRSLFHVPIVDVKYDVNEHDKKVRCIIHWRNPANNNVQKSIGISRCNISDDWDEIFGKRLAESRAKIMLYKTYVKNIYDLSQEVMSKHITFKYNEIEHFEKLLKLKEK